MRLRNVTGAGKRLNQWPRKMRLELALIVGILFFCSWCAYIVARMNASVSTGESSSSSAPSLLDTNQANWTANSSPPHQDSNQRLNRESHSTGQPPSARHQPVQQHHFGASEPEVAWQQQQQQMNAQAPYALGVQVQPAVVYQRPKLAPVWPPQAAAPDPWQTYALPTRLSAPSAPHANQFGPAPELLDPQSEQDQLEQDERQLVGAPPTEAADYEDEDTAASDYVTPQQQPEEGAGDAELGEPNNQADDQEEGAPDTGTELDELSQRRVFNELQSDSTERDKNGNLLLTRRRHLINGKPVGRSRRRQPVVVDDENNYAESARDNRRAEARPPTDSDRAQEVDFERLVGEFENEDELRKLRAAGKRPDVAPTGGQRAAEALIRSSLNGRPEWSVAERLKRRSGGRGQKGLEAWQSGPARAGQMQESGTRVAGAQTIRRPPEEPTKPKQETEKKDEHQHRLQETLEQQQWDDDAATSVAERPNSGPEAADEANAEKVSDIVEQDEEARQLEDLSRELMLNPQFAELTRRRRSIGAVSADQSASEAGSWSADGRNGFDERDENSAFQERPLDEDRDDLRDSDQRDAQVGSVGAAEASAARLSAPRVNMEVPDESSSSQRPEAMSDDYESLDRSPTEAPLEEEAAAAAAAAKLAPSNRSKPVVSEIGSQLRRHANMASANEAPTELVSGQEDMHVEVLAQAPISLGLNNFSAPVQSRQLAPSAPMQQSGADGLVEFPRVASPFPSGSSKVGKKKKAIEHSKKRSNMIDSKYKAARAYAKKQRSKQKKGSTRGHKKAHGGGIKGARKGSTYLKDKGYKKKGFKKAYHKLETGDHKTYFDEFRDKDHNKKWKDFDDKHKYSQRKKWAGNDVRHLKHHDLKEARGKASKSARWKESAMSKHLKKAKKYQKANEVANKSYSSEAKKKKKKKRKKKH